MLVDYYSDNLKPWCCGSCSTIPTTKLQRCTACKSIIYCNVECQKKHWRTHKKQCKVWKEKKDTIEKIVEIDIEKNRTAPMGATNLYITGTRLALGDGDFPFEPKLACKLFEAATEIQTPIEGGHPTAMLNLGIHHERGIGVTQSYAKAYKYYKSVMQHPFPGEETVKSACLALSRFHRDGLGLADQSNHLAAKYYTFSQSNAENRNNILHLERWWEENGMRSINDQLMEKVLNWDK